MVKRKYILMISIIAFFLFFMRGEVLASYESERQDIYDYKEFFDELYPVEESELKGSNSCSAFSNITVTTTSCDDSVEYGTFTLDDYIKGVFLAEEDDTHDNGQYLAAWMIIIRSFVLGQAGYTSTTGDLNIKIRSCSLRQNWCDFEKGCFRDYSTGNGSHPSMAPCPEGGCSYHKYPSSKHYTASELDLFNEAIAQTKNLVASSDEGKSVQTLYYYSCFGNGTSCGGRPFSGGVDAEESIIGQQLSNSSATFNDYLTNAYPAISSGKTKIVEWSNSSSNECSVSNGKSNGEFENWKQQDKRWGSVSLGNSTIAAIGCAATSVSIQIARSGAKLSVDSLDPGVFVKTLKANGGFTSGGEIYWDAARFVAPDFRYVKRVNVSGSKSTIAKEVSKYLSQGYYIVMSVNYTGHWVAITEVKDGNIYMLDPSNHINTKNFTTQYAHQGSHIMQLYKVNG